MDSSLDSSADESGNQGAGIDRRMTRVLTEEDVRYLDQNSVSDIDDTFVEETGQRSTLCSPEQVEDMVDQVKDMTTEEVQVLIHKLHLSQEDTDEKYTDEEDVVDKVEKTNPEQNKQQKNKPPKAQPKKITKEGTKSSKSNAEIESNTNKPKRDVKGKKNNPRSAQVDAHSEENLRKLEHESNKRVAPDNPPENPRKDENPNKTSKPKDNAEVQENKSLKSINEKGGLDSNKVKQNKSSRKVGNDNSVKESGSNTLENVDSYGVGRVMRSRRAKPENATNVLQEINEPVKNPVSEIVMGQNKKNIKKPDLEMKNPEEKPISTVTSEESTAGQKKKTGKNKKIGKKVASETKKSEETPVPNEKGIAVQVKNAGKKNASEIKEPQENPIANIKEEGTTSRLRKNVRKDISEAVENVVQNELDPTVKNTKARKKPTNSKVTEIVEESPTEGMITAAKTKLKSKPDPVTNKKLLENKENKVNEEAIPNKRAGRKK